MGFLVLTVLVLAVAAMVLLARGPATGPVPQLAGALLVLLPPLLMTLIIHAGQEQPLTAGRHGANTPWRVTLAALRFPLTGEALTIGGDAQADDLVIPGLPVKSRSTLQLAGAQQLLTLKDEAPGPRGGSLTVKEAPEGADPFGGTPLPPGATVCLSDTRVCDADSQQLRVQRQGDTAVLVSAAGTGCPLPPPAGARAASSVAKRVFPIATYARPGCSGRERFAWGEGEPAEELLYWQERPLSFLERLMFWRTRPPHLFLLPVDDSRHLIVLDKGGATRIGRAPPQLAPGEEARVSVYQIIPAAALPSADRGDDNFARLQERRSFRLRYTQGAGTPALDVFLDTPQTVALTTSARPVISISSQSASPESLVGGAQIAGFSLLGKPTAAGLLSTVRTASLVPGALQTCSGREEALLVQGVTGISCARLGRWFALGDPARVLAKVRIAPLVVPVAWIAAIWALFLVNLLVRDALKTPVPARIILAVVEILLVLRVLVAFEAAAVDSRREDAVAGAWLALLWLPLAFELTVASTRPALLTFAVRGAKGLLALLGTLLIVRASGLSGGSLAQWGGWLSGEMGKSALVSVLLCLPAWWLQQSSRWKPASRLSALPGWPLSPLATAGVLLAGLSVVHLLLVMAGIKEQIGGVRIASVLIPLLVLAWAHWYALLAPARGQLPPRLESAALFLPFLGYLSFALAHDIGAYIYFLALAAWLSVGAWPQLARLRVLWGAVACLVGALLLLLMSALGPAFRPLGVAGALGLLVALMACVVLAPRREPARLRPHLASLPALAVIGVLCAVQAGGYLLQQQAGERGQRAGWQDVARIQSLSANAIRVLDVLAPAAVENLGVRAAYEQRVAMAEMLEYGGTLAGRGWLRIPPPDSLRQTHVDDNVTAVHLLGPFGRAGGLGVGLLLLTFTVCIYWLTAQLPAALRNRARLGATVLTVTSLYMLLANIAQVPFTGRNFYFLAVSSHSDLLEGGLLLTLVLSAFAHGDRPRTAPGAAHAA